MPVKKGKIVKTPRKSPRVLPPPPVMPFFNDEQAQLFVKQVVWLHEHEIYKRPDAFFYLQRAMCYTVPKILSDPAVQKSPVTEGKRIGKLLWKYTSQLTEYREMCENKLLLLLRAFVEEKPKSQEPEAKKRFTQEVVFWSAVEDNFKVEQHAELATSAPLDTEG